MNPHNAAYLRKIKELEHKVKLAVPALELCRDIFQKYADLHKAKGTSEAEGKAASNLLYSLVCSTCLLAINHEHSASTTQSSEQAQEGK